MIKAYGTIPKYNKGDKLVCKGDLIVHVVNGYFTDEKMGWVYDVIDENYTMYKQFEKDLEPFFVETKRTDAEALQLMIDDKTNRYKMFVDNDDIYIMDTETPHEDYNDGTLIHGFDRYGQDFIVWVLQQLKINADYV